MQNEGHVIRGDEKCVVADMLRQHPISVEELRARVVFDNNQDWNQDTRWSLRNQTDLQSILSQQTV